MKIHPTFQLSDARKQYADAEALAPTSLTIAPGERVALVGPSGSGKTTFLRLLNGTVPTTTGTVSLLGKDITSLTPDALRKLRSRIATIPQHLGLVASLRVIQNVATGRIGSRGLLGGLRDVFFPSDSTANEIHQLLNRVGIEEKLYAYTSQLSGGQRQRVAVARALFQQPDAILADEPVSSVDPARAASLVELITNLAEEQGLTLVMSLHNLDLARAHFPRLLGLRDGTVVFDGAPEDLEEETFADLYRLTTSELVNDE